MEAIGFKNFRRFKEMPPIKLGGINMFVGGNNAGKSTVVKGLLLLIDFLKNSKTPFSEPPKFRFDGPESHDVNIDTFKRALCWDTDENEIIFNSTIDDFDIEVCIYSPKDVKKEDVAYADVKYFKLTDNKTGINFDFQFTEFDQKYGATITTQNKKYKIRHQKDFWSDDLPDVVSYLGGLTTSYFGEPNNVDEEDEKNRNALKKAYDSQLNDIRIRFHKAISRIHPEYIYSHDASQKVLYNKKDENDYVSKSIHEFYNQRITSKSPIGKKFVCKWLRKFCNVDDYRITTTQGVAYQFELKTDGKWVNLADMGRGAIQIVTLLVRIASIIKKYEKDDILLNILLSDDSKIPIVFVEEPEQNLHPALQSQLTDLFYDAYEQYGIHFIIETHSEYMVRKTQILVANFHYKSEFDLVAKNPFEIYYFPETGNPFNMGYTPKGGFIKNFDSGFFDEAVMLQYALMKGEKGV